MAEFTEQQVYEALGLGEQEREPAEPAPMASEGPTGEQEREVAAPAQQERTPEEPPRQEQVEPEQTAGEVEEAPQKVERPPLTTEQRRQNAAMRRQQEEERRRAEIDRAVQDALQRERQSQEKALSAFFAQAGLKDSFTGETITNLDQFNTWNKKFEDAKLRRELKAGNLTPEGLSAAIDAHPVVQQAQRLIEQDTAAKQAREETAAREKLESELRQIHELDESISTLEDLTKAEYWPQLYDMTKRGYSVKDAHFLLNHEKLERAKLEAAKAQGMMSARGKEHMAPVGAARGGGSVSVPAAELEVFRQMMPNATDAQIQDYYNKYKKG